MYKLIAMDLDGTLLNDNKEITQENLKLINLLDEKGYEIVIATGRRYWSAKQLTRGINNHITILANNGNIVRHSSDDKEIITKYLNLDDFRTIMKEGKKRNLYPIIHIDDFHGGIDVIIELDEDNENYYNYLKNSSRFKQVKNYLDIKNNILTVVYVGEKNELNDFHLNILKEYPNLYNSHIMENIAVAEALLEIMHPQGTKWLSLLEYATSINIKREEIIAIGDDNNDIEMIKNAGLGIAMKNATEAVKAVTEHITEKDNNESGVAFELKRVLNL
ncbi:MAG TPA: Cof-type HAD-IIB family hydrolase [Tissierellaceae bacterium]|nr:Cof-type HAD-IIB family hydrolase [Tissierellaceae bacterium]